MLKGLLVSDLHSGSIYSVAVQKARTDTVGGTIGLNPLQSKILLPKWKEMCSAEPYDFVVVLGDLVDGLNQKSKGMGLWTCVLDLQAENAAKLLNMIPVKPEAPIDIIGGTPYHRGENPGIDQSVAEKLAAMNKNSRYRGLEYLLEIEKQRFHFCHWAPNALYDGTSLAKEVLLSKKHEIPLTGMFRGHRHHYGFYSDGFRFACMLPAWKGRDEYVQTYGMKYATTQIGFAELEVAKDYWNVTPTLWNLKDQMKVSKIAGQKETFQE